MIGLSLFDLAFMALASTNAIAADTTMPTNNLVLWVKADAQTLTDGALAVDWPDSSGGAPMYQWGAWPRWYSNKVNGKPAFNFTYNDAFGVTRTNLTSYHVLAVCKLSTVTFESQIFLCGSTDGGLNQVAAFRGDTTKLYAYNGGVQPESTSSPSVYSTFALIEWINDIGEWDFMDNGVSLGTYSADIFPSGAMFFRMSATDNGSGPILGYVAEIAVYDSAGTPTVRAARREALRLKYALY